MTHQQSIPPDIIPPNHRLNSPTPPSTNIETGLFDTFGATPPYTPRPDEELSFTDQNPDFGTLRYYNPLNQEIRGRNKHRPLILAGLGLTAVLTAARLAPEIAEHWNPEEPAPESPANNEIIVSDSEEQAVELKSPSETVINIEASREPIMSAEKYLNEQQTLTAERVLREQTPDVMRYIEENMPLYIIAAEQTGVDWKIIATIHYREGDNNPNQSLWAGENLGEENPDNPGEVKPFDLQENVISAAEHFVNMAWWKYRIKADEPLTEDQIDLAFLAYNRGETYKNNGAGPQDTPYVYNYFNGNQMSWPSSLVLEGRNSQRGELDEKLGSKLMLNYLRDQENNLTSDLNLTT